jgi:hypothetical protein|eukprot:COSAG06_NODE_909_length_11599_cov_61.006087_12_plen_261_part_00
MWGVMPGSFDAAQNRTVWTDGRAKVHISTVSPRKGRHALRINSPKPAQTLRVGVPGDGIKGYNLSSTSAAGQLNVPNCLFNNTRYELHAFVRASRYVLNPYGMPCPFLPRLLLLKGCLSAHRSVHSARLMQLANEILVGCNMIGMVSQIYSVEQADGRLGRAWLSFGRQKYNNSDYSVPHFVPWSEQTAVLGAPVVLTTQWQPLRVVLPAQQWPCQIDRGPIGSQQNAWDAPLYGRGQQWPWHLELAFEGGAEMRFFSVF